MTNRRFPIHGRSWDEVRAAMEEARRDDLPWYSQRMFKGGSYYGGADVVDVANDAYRMYINYNALFANTMFPSLARYEAEIVGALLEMLNAPEGAGGRRREHHHRWNGEHHDGREDGARMGG